MILVVDDDRDVREVLCGVLDSEGYAVAGARNGAEALAVLHSNPARVCLVILDVMMPVMSGVEFRERQRQDATIAAIPVAVMSARWEAQEAQEAFAGLPFLRKPMRLDDVLTVVRRHCGASSTANEPAGDR